MYNFRKPGAKNGNSGEEVTMSHSAVSNRLQVRFLTTFLFFAPFAFADVFELSPAVPPVDGVFTVANTCVSVVCLENITISHFDVTGNTISGGNEYTVADVVLGASVFQNVSGSPGAFISPVQLTGQMDITYFDKLALSEQGTFSDQITSLELTGSFNGLTGTHTVTAMLNPDESSTGQTTITNVGGTPTEFRITSFFDVFTELSVDGGAYVPGPERTATLGVTPEPAYFGAIGVLVAAMLLRRVVKPTSRNQPVPDAAQ